MSERSITADLDQSPGRKCFIRLWLRFCRFVVKIFYRRFEITGREYIPENEGLILCANHINALADVVILQASTDKILRPLARSGLFENPLLKPVLDMIGAVPVYRQGDKGSDVTENENSFKRCFELLAINETLIIFPEGQSHSDPYLHELKTGAARMALGAIATNNRQPVVLPVGLTFTQKGKFRSDVLVQYGKPIDLTVHTINCQREQARTITDRISKGLQVVTLNAQSWKELVLMDQLEKFFALRHGKFRNRNLGQRFRSLQRIINAKQLLQDHEPERVRSLMIQLKMFERLCRCCGVRAYHLGITYQPLLLTLYIIQILCIILIAYPIALWGILNSFIPYKLTRYFAKKAAKAWDQFDTSKMILGLVLFPFFWLVQATLVYHLFGAGLTLFYIASIVIGSFAAMKLRGEYHRIIKDLKVFFLFLSKQELKAYLIMKRHEIEIELARLVRIAKRLSSNNQSA